MTPSPRAEFANAAKRDLAEIWRFTTRRWSPDQADAYLRLLNAAALRVASEPQLGRPIIGSTALRYAAKAHLLIYRPFDGGVRIVRVLHQRMDLPRHLRR